jgi:hypothetical protein
MSFIWKASENSFEENARWCQLRAIEWKAWPAYIGQSIVPVLFAFYPFYNVIIGLFIICWLWILIRNQLMSVALASLGARFVVITKWPVCILMCIYFLYEGNYIPAVLAIIWPWIGSVVSFPCVIGPGIGIYEKEFMRKLGYSFDE